MKTCPYRPLGQRVILKILPVHSTSIILMPDGTPDPKTRQTFEVIAVGGQVNDATFSLNVGDVVLIGCHNSQILPLNEEEQLIVVDRAHIVCVTNVTTLN